VFLLKHIWGRGVAKLAVTAGLALVVAVATATGAEATGERYVWKDTAKTAITASGGNFGSASVEFAKTGSQASQQTFAANASYTCGQTTYNSQLTIAISQANLNVNPSSGQISGANPACAADPLRSFSPPVISTAGVNDVTGETTDEATATPDCDQGGFTWLFCPVIDNVSEAVSSLARDALVPMLKVNQVTKESTPELFTAWAAMRDVANILFILVFFVIIAGTLMQQDIYWFNNYTIRQLWVSLVMGAILVQFSFYIAGFFVDIGNVAGAGIETLITTVGNPADREATLGNVVQNLVTGAVGVFFAGGAALVALSSWASVIPLLLSLLLSLLVVFLTLGARFLIIAILVVMGPIACVAMVLPNTRHYFIKWCKLFVRLVMMYPMVVGILVMAGLINRLLPFDTSAAASGPAVVAAAIKPLLSHWW
jgi:hypothetical protein